MSDGTTIAVGLGQRGFAVHAAQSDGSVGFCKALSCGRFLAFVARQGGGLEKSQNSTGKGLIGSGSENAAFVQEPLGPVC